MKVLSSQVSSDFSDLITGVICRVFTPEVKHTDSIERPVFTLEDRSIPPDFFQPAFPELCKIARFISMSPEANPGVYRSRKTTKQVPNLLLPNL